MNRILLLAVGSILLLGTGLYIGTTLDKVSGSKETSDHQNISLSPLLPPTQETSEKIAAQQWAMIQSRAAKVAELKKATNSSLKVFKASLIREFPTIPPAAFQGESYDEIAANAARHVKEDAQRGKSAQLTTAVQREISNSITSFEGQLADLTQKYRTQVDQQKKTVQSVLKLKKQGEKSLVGPAISAAQFHKITQRIPRRLLAKKGNTGAKFDTDLDKKIDKYRRDLTKKIPPLRLEKEQVAPRPGLVEAYKRRNENIRARNRAARAAYQAKLNGVETKARAMAKAEMGPRPKGYKIAGDNTALSPNDAEAIDWENYQLAIQQVLPPGWRASTVPRPNADNPTHRVLLVKTSD